MEKGKKISNNYAIYEEKLGEGAFGVIYKGYSKKDNCIVAIKKLKGEGANQWFTDPKFKLETEVLLKVKHPNVVRVYEALEIGRDVYIVMEYCDSGDLKKKITVAKRDHQEKGLKEIDGQSPFSQIFVYDIFCQICAGMAEVNRNSILFAYSEYMHRDLKLENVMLTDVGTVKIADFGLARGIIGNDLYKMERFSAKGTPLYAAPDILQKKDYSVKCDVFSLGLMIYEMLAGKHLFSSARVLILSDSEHD